MHVTQFLLSLGIRSSYVGATRGFGPPMADGLDTFGLHMWAERLPAKDHQSHRFCLDKPG